MQNYTFSDTLQNILRFFLKKVCVRFSCNNEKIMLGYTYKTYILYFCTRK